MADNNKMRIDSIDKGAAFQEQVSSKRAMMSRELTDLADVDLNSMNEIEKAAVREKCQEVETLFVKMMLDQVRKSLKSESSGSNAMDQGKDIYQEMLYDEYAKNIAKQSGGIGIATLIFDQITSPKMSAAEAIARYNKN